MLIFVGYVVDIMAPDELWQLVSLFVPGHVGAETDGLQDCEQHGNPLILV